MFEGCGHAELLQVQWSRYSAPCFLNSQLPENDLLVYYMYIYIYIYSSRFRAWTCAGLALVYICILFIYMYIYVG
jgi:hypothetical protein